MPGLADIHAHVLPGIDDGPPDLDASLAMARAGAEAGITTLVSTPHLRSDFPNVHVEELAARCEDLRQAIAGEGIELELVSGAESSLVWALEASDDQLRLASYGQGGSDLLIETPLSNAVGLDRLLHTLRLKGYRIALAHPERSMEFQRHPELLEDLVARGVLLQVNAETLIDSTRRSSTRKLAHHLVTAGLAHAIASDGHRGQEWRPVTSLAAGAEALSTLVGPARAEWMTRLAPRAIVAGEPVGDGPDVEARRRRRRLFERR